jgi:uroporphyrinogen decarboxylase
VVAMDSDGYIGDLIPIWIDAGIRACNPIEVAAGNDIVALRKRFGRDMAYWGGIDKRAIAAGGSAIEREVARVCALFGMGGGLVASCDHGVPPDISWQNFVRYGGLLAKACGW